MILELSYVWEDAQSWGYWSSSWDVLLSSGLFIPKLSMS